MTTTSTATRTREFGPVRAKLRRRVPAIHLCSETCPIPSPLHSSPHIRFALTPPRPRSCDQLTVREAASLASTVEGWKS